VPHAAVKNRSTEILLVMEAKKNYQRILEDTIKSNCAGPEKPTLLLHACCGPCSSYVIEYISRFFQVTVFYYNPNIYPQEEYERRLSELENLLPRFECAVRNNVKLVVSSYDPEEFYAASGTRENPELAHEQEKGERCRRCYEFRLRKAHEYAAENGFDYFCTTLSISPFKDAGKINIIGSEIESQNPDGPKWLFSDFKKKGGFLRSLELSEIYGLYRQTYCGCVFSFNNSNSGRGEQEQ